MFKPPRLALLTLFALVVGLNASAFAETAPPAVLPTSGPWSSSSGFTFDLNKKKSQKVRRSVSGMACNLDAKQQRICLMAFDEGGEARYAYVGNEVLKIETERVVLRATSGELDAEGAATDGRYFYVTGSHSAKRSDCSSNPDSRHVIRLKLNPATGRALQPTGGSSATALPGYADTGRLWQLMQSQPELQAYVGDGKCLGTESPAKNGTLAGQQGVNIEGLAVKDGVLYFGFRGPALNGVAKVLAVNADALFSPEGGSNPKVSVTPIALGERRGVRDMVAVKSGFLLLAGPDDDESSQAAGWTVAWWDGKSSSAVVQPRLLAALDLSQVTLRKCDKELKPEALTVLEETPKNYKLLVLSDGMCDGGPLAFTIPK